jgi:hypothetical protein
VHVTEYYDWNLDWQVVPGQECYPGLTCQYHWTRNDKYWYPGGGGAVNEIKKACAYGECGGTFVDDWWPEPTMPPSGVNGYRNTETHFIDCDFTEVASTIGPMSPVPWVHVATTNYTVHTTERCLWEGTDVEHLTMTWTSRLSRTAQTTVNLDTGNLRSTDSNRVPLWSSSKPVPFRLEVEALWQGGAPISATNGFTVAGQQCDANGEIFLQFLENQSINVTPALPAKFTNYTFNVSILSHKIVRPTRQYHQMFHLATNSVPTLLNLQTLFTEGAGALAQDNDTKIGDGDSRVGYSTNASSLYRTDDAPCCVEFEVLDGPTNYCIPAYTNFPVLPCDPFGPERYFNIRQEADLDQLLGYAGTHIKQVNSIETDASGTVRGAAVLGSLSMVLAASASAITCMHEYGHNCNLMHRSQPDASGNIPNPGPVLNAIMGPPTVVPTVLRNEVNRWERDQIYTSPH